MADTLGNTDLDLAELIGDPDRVYNELREFQKSARILSSPKRRLRERYPEQWVGICGGRVQANAETMGAVLDTIDAKGLSREDTIVRFITREPKTLIL